MNSSIEMKQIRTCMSLMQDKTQWLFVQILLYKSTVSFIETLMEEMEQQFLRILILNIEINPIY